MTLMARFEKRLLLLAHASGILLLLSACAMYEVVPKHLEGQVRKDLTWEQVAQHPEAYEGMTVIWGGKVLDVTHAAGQTRVELQHLPLDDFFHPVITSSAERYSAVDARQEMKNTAALQKDTLVTVIGQVRSRTTGAEDGLRDRSPTLVVRDMTAWQREVGMKSYAPGSPLVGTRPFVFWESQRVTGYQ